MLLGKELPKTRDMEVGDSLMVRIVGGGQGEVVAKIYAYLARLARTLAGAIRGSFNVENSIDVLKL